MDTKPCCDLFYYTHAGVFPFYNIDLKKKNWKITMVRTREEGEEAIWRVQRVTECVTGGSGHTVLQACSATPTLGNV